MVSEEEILGQFQMYNICPSTDVISKCLAMCLSYDIDAEELVDQWIAYTSSNLRGAAPTVEYLEKMERKEFQKTKEQVKKLPTHKEQSYASHQPSGPSLEVQGTPKGQHENTSKIQTPIQPRNILTESLETTISSPSSQSGSYGKRTDARSVRCSHGPTDATYKGVPYPNLTIKPYIEDGLKSGQRFMFEILGKRGKSLNNMAEDLILTIRDKYNLGVPDEEENDETKTIYNGRIMSDTNGKLNNQSVLLEQLQSNKGRTLYLNFSKVQKYSLFPGQAVVVKGEHHRLSRTRKDQVLVEEIYADTNFNLPSDPAITTGTLQIVTACGPFTLQDNLSFEPLHDLLNYVKESSPNVLILMGPFYERTNPAIFNGDLRQTFDSLFIELVDHIMATLKDIDIHVVIVSSQKEPHHFPVYPTPPYEVRGKSGNLTFMPDPCIIDIDGLVIGATTTDILFHISNFEIYMDKTSSGPPDRMGRLASHLLKQQSFYPLDPPTKDMCIDMTLMERFGTMAVKPHILVLPSNLRNFVKEIDRCLVVNPERITKGYGGGTFARIEVRPGGTVSVCGRTACQILKI